MRKSLLIFLASLGLLGIAYAAEIEDLDTSDAANTGRFPENMAPSAVNNGARALEGLLARFYNDIGCRISTGGSANAYTFAASQAITSYYDGLILCFDANFANTGTATLNVDGKGAKTIQRNGAALPAGAIESGQKVLVTYDGTNFEVLSVARAVTSASDVITTRGDIISGDSAAGPARLAVGNADEILATANGTDVVWRAITAYQATQAQLEGGTVSTVFTSPERQQHHPSAAKAWIRFAIDGTDNASFNVASITDNGVGDWSVNIATDMSGAAYLVFATAYDNMPSASSNHSNIVENSGRAKTAGVFHILNFDIQATPAVEDPVNVNAMAFGDQ